MYKYITVVFTLLGPGAAFAAEQTAGKLDLTNHLVGYIAVALFALAYLLVMAEEFTHLRKSKPVMLAAGVIWAAIAFIYIGHDDQHLVEQAARHNLLEYAELMLFLLVAMTYVTAMTERRVFDALRIWLLKKGYGYKKLFWMTGCMSFVMS
ncbi:MAG: sodium:proton antiporter NhaD, partial [Gammaproteobacteria bacterium]